MNEQIQHIMSNLPDWAREPAALIAAGVVVGLLLLWLLSRLFSSPARDEEVVEPVEFEDYPPVVRPITPPPVTPPPPPIADGPLEPPVIEQAPESHTLVAPEAEAVAVLQPEPEVLAAPEREPEPEPQTDPEIDTVIETAAPEPSSPDLAEEAPEPAPLADEPIAAAAPFDASPASIAAYEAEPVVAPAPEPQPAPLAPEPVEAAPAGDELSRMKGVGPRLADRLNSVGITSFAQIAALTPEDADALDAKLGDFQGRIHRDRWIEQAGYLASGDIAGFEAVFGKL